MAKRHLLPTLSFGADPALPGVAGLAGWVAENRGKAADIITYLLEASQSPQIAAGIGTPCAGGRFYADRLREVIVCSGDGADCGIHTETAAVRRDAEEVASGKKESWFAMPAPHLAGFAPDRRRNVEEWNAAIAEAYRTVMREMRDGGIAGNVLIADRMLHHELASLARRKVFFFAPSPSRKDLETLLEFQQRPAVPGDRLEIVFDLMNEYEVAGIVLMDPDPAAIRRALTRFDPDQITIGGYCVKDCDGYWKDLVAGAVYTA